jgi:hypothetical protein
MRKVTNGLVLALLVAGACAAQEWEVGGMASYGFYRNLAATSPVGSATAGFGPGTAFGAVLGYKTNSWLSGEFRYTYRDSQLQLSSGGTEARFNGVAHAIHYDLVMHPRPKHGTKALPFLAVGGGMKLYQGTGHEVAYQPLDNIALLTKTQQAKPMISVGGGVKMVLGPRLVLRAEVRDYLTTFPKDVIAPVPGTKISGWLNDFVPMVGISYIF